MTPLPWLRALKETARSGLMIERAAMTPLLALRGACGVAIVIGLALGLGSPQLAVASAFGAFASGVATFQRSWRPRPVLALAAAAGLAVSTFLGYLLAAWPPAFVVLLAVWSFGAGMAWSVGPTSGVVAALTIAVMLVTVTLPTTVAGALVHAALIAMGGVVQALLIVLFPIRRWGDARDALADALAGVADYARRLRHDPTAPFDPEPLIEARKAAAVTPRQARRRPRQLRGYRAMAERFRPVLASLADPVVGGAPTEGPERDRVRELLAAAATVLDATAHAIRHGERVRVPEEALNVLQVPESGPVLSGPARRAAMRLIALTDDAVDAAEEPVEVTRPNPVLPNPIPQRSAWHTLSETSGIDLTATGGLRKLGKNEKGGHGDGSSGSNGKAGDGGKPRNTGSVGGAGRFDSSETTGSIPLPPKGAAPAEGASAEGSANGSADGSTTGSHRAVRRPRHLYRPTLAGMIPVAMRAYRREFRLSSPIFRHALRTCAVTTLGWIIGKLLPPEHGYWIALTAVMVLRPDFSRTFERGVARFAGTLVGVAIGAAATALLAPGAWASAGLAVLCLGLNYLLMKAGYAISSACIGAYVVFLLGIAGSVWSQTAVERIGLTALGGVLAMLSYAVYPAWETPQLRDRLADWLAANGRYAVAVLDRFADPAGGTSRQVREALLDQRAARQEWDQMLSRADAEPVRHRGRLSHRAAAEAQSAMLTMGRVTMLLEPHLPGRTAEPDPDAEDFAATFGPSVEEAARAVREGGAVDWAPVHEALQRWWDRVEEPPPVALRTADLLADALDDLAGAVNPRTRTESRKDG
ncbi:FUSC family protein [Streptomyces sp. ODS28]|uniref:FUSC family protein n=1 Tax=Streptomyces sp. ODS28 TaxID=3136688 RepID=UPI0031F090B1